MACPSQRGRHGAASCRRWFVGSHRACAAEAHADGAGWSPPRVGPPRADRDRVRAAHRDPVGRPSGRVRMQWSNLRQSAPRVACGGRLDARPPAPARTAAACRRDRLVTGLGRHGTNAGQKGGAQTGPNPTDRGKPGSKHVVIGDRHGTPLAPPMLVASNRPDVVLLLPMVDRVAPVRGRPGRPRRRPDKLHGDLGFRSRANVRGLRARGIVPRLARKGIESRERLGRYRWVAERDLAWLHRFRRLRIRDDCRADVHEAFLTLASILILWNVIRRVER
jgi:hypothetical protein